jgi:8-oxo-dGTP pyrophosphatase MutT (NUDIX family)
MTTGGIIEVVAAVIRRGDKILLASRPADKPPTGWEFPGGKVEPEESFVAAAIRELREELGVNVAPGQELGSVENGSVRIHFIAAELPESEIPAPQEHQQCFWVELSPEPPEQLLPADRDFWRKLARMNKIC